MSFADKIIITMFAAVATPLWIYVMLIVWTLIFNLITGKDRL